MKAIVTPLGCARCGARRPLHDATDHRYQVPDWDAVLERARALKEKAA